MARNVKEQLVARGFTELEEGEPWSDVVEAGGKYLITRHEGTIIAVAVGGRCDGTRAAFKLLGGHTDTPVLKVRPVSKRSDADGKDKSAAMAQLQPSADDDAEAPATDGWASHHPPALVDLVAHELGVEPEDVADFDLTLFDTQAGAISGARPATPSRRRSSATPTTPTPADDADVSVVALFDHEEIGSASAHGAGSPVLGDALVRLHRSLRKAQGSGAKDGLEDAEALAVAMRRSILLSVDMAHAVHPNYAHKHDGAHAPRMNHGLVLKVNNNQRYTTDAVTGFLLRETARRGGLPELQDFVVRNDCPCGSTIGPILASRFGIRAADVGMPQLSMHSIREMGGVHDIDLRRLLPVLPHSRAGRLAEQALVDRGADLNAYNLERGCLTTAGAPLAIVAKKARHKVIELMLNLGADANATDATGATMYGSELESARVLIRAGADPLLQTAAQAGETSRLYAGRFFAHDLLVDERGAASGLRDVLALLRAAIAGRGGLPSPEAQALAAARQRALHRAAAADAVEHGGDPRTGRGARTSATVRRSELREGGEKAEKAVHKALRSDAKRLGRQFVCDYCGKHSSAKLSACARCKFIFYCGANIQRKLCTGLLRLEIALFASKAGSMASISTRSAIDDGPELEAEASGGSPGLA
ncbi:aminopeptidase [Aureococcus anophagefferens]|nr:aminopeptidase [Aureococcus anophagefferens]